MMQQAKDYFSELPARFLILQDICSIYIHDAASQILFQRASSSLLFQDWKIILSKRMMQQPQDYWLDFFSEACVSAVYEGTSIQEGIWMRDSDHQEGVQIRACGGSFLGDPPQLGEHNQEILRDAGLGKEEIQFWIDEGVLQN